MRLRLLWCCLALALTLPGLAHAGVPTPPPWSRIPKGIALVGTAAGLPDSTIGQFQVFISSYGALQPATMFFDFSSAPDVRVASVQAQPFLSVQCLRPVIIGRTNRIWIGFYTLVGGGTGTANPGPSVVKVYADGIFFGTLPVAVYDLDGTGGLGAGDLSIWLSDLGSGEFRARSDYNFDGVLDTNDLSMWLTAFGAAGSAESASSTCP